MKRLVLKTLGSGQTLAVLPVNVTVSLADLIAIIETVPTVKDGVSVEVWS